MEKYDKLPEFQQSLEEIVREGARKMLHQAIENEVEEFIHSPSLQRLVLSLLKKLKKLWVFAIRDGVEPTNNQAERDSRGIVLWRKISYGSKSKRGDLFTERIYSIEESD